MTSAFRALSLAATAAVLLLSGIPAAAAGPTQNATVTANVRRPLTIELVQSMSFGTILLSGAGPFTATVSIARTGVRTCPASVTCTGASTAAIYNVKGTNRETVLISAPNVTLTSGSDTLLMTTNAPASIALTNSGHPGMNVAIGGSITVTDATPDGFYQGIFNVTAEYQ